MSKKIITGIDIGTAKITTVIASIPESGVLNIMGVATNPSKGIRKGQIVDIEEATSSIVESLEAAERMAGYSISSAFISVGGSHVVSQNSHGVVAVAEPNKEINSDDVARAIDAAKAISLPSSREVMHVLPREFIVDSQEGIKDPAGMTGVRLEVDTHIITVSSTALRNLEKCASLVGVDVDGFVFNGVASATSVLTETEKELGVVLVDIGAGTTDICIYAEGSLSYSSVLPIGARNITNDLAIGLRISIESAEKIKVALDRKSRDLDQKTVNMEDVRDRKHHDKKDDEIDLTDLNLAEGITKISKKTVVDGIIRPRLNEIFTMIGQELKKSTFGGLTPAGIVICGGGALTMGIIECARRNLAMQVRIGTPEKLSGLIDEIVNPMSTTAAGLVLYGVRHQQSESEKFSMNRIGKIMGKVPIQGFAGKIFDAVKSFLP